MATADAMYNLGLFSARCQLLAFRYVPPKREEGSEKADEAAAHDAARMLTLALNYYINKQNTKTDDYDSSRFLSGFKKVSRYQILKNMSLSRFKSDCKIQ